MVLDKKRETNNLLVSKQMKGIYKINRGFSSITTLTVSSSNNKVRVITNRLTFLKKSSTVTTLLLIYPCFFLLNT